MKTKTLVAKSAIDIDEQMRKLNEVVKVKFTQTHVGFSVNGEPSSFVAVAFYEERED